MSKFAGLALAVEKPERMVLRDPVSRKPLKDKDGNPACIDLYSNDSEVARKYDNAALQRRLNSRGGPKLSADELMGEATERLAHLTAGWNLVDLQGNPLDVKFSTDAAGDLYSESAISWLREQAEEFVADRANFVKP